jgi:F0F1-type ATP synthase membrane subunit c/vacuolar-type H+-ATPase subunit K
MMNRNEIDAGIDARLRTLRILWAAFVASVVLYALVAYFAAPAPASPGGEQSPLIYVFFALGLFFVAVSFGLRQNFYGKAERDGQPGLVQTGLILALAFCEVAALLGLVALFVLKNPLAYSLFALAVLGDVLHFPGRDQLLAASNKVAGR